MTSLTRILLMLVILSLTLAGVGIIFFISSYPDIERPADITIHTTPERVARGRYLANHVTVCMDCHSSRNWTYFAGPIIPGTEGQGGEQFGPDVFPGTFYASNITATHLGHWTDGEIVRAITSGVNRRGDALHSIMPYEAYNRLSEDHVHAIVAYVRTLKPISSDVPARSLDFPFHLTIRTQPIAYRPEPAPDPADSIAYGGYLAVVSGCLDCHTPRKEGKKVTDLMFAGGFESPLPGGGVVVSSNITPDPVTGIGSWSKKAFIDRFKMYEHPDMRAMVVPDGQKNTVMPWLMYAGMKEEDLEALYVYLRTVPPVRHQIGTFGN